MAIGTALKQRSDKVAFYGVPGEASGVTYHRMAGFTDTSISKNPTEYSRRYVDEDAEQTDVTGYSPAIAYAFDSYVGNAVHEDIAKIADGELIGTAAVRSIIVVDMTTTGTAENSRKGIMRDYAVIPDSEGDSTDAYTYSGNMRSKSTIEEVEVTSADNWATITLVDEDSV